MLTLTTLRPSWPERCIVWLPTSCGQLIAGRHPRNGHKGGQETSAIASTRLNAQSHSREWILSIAALYQRPHKACAYVERARTGPVTVGN